MLTGTVKWFSPFTGCGYITADTGLDYYIQAADINTDGLKILDKFSRVSFEASRTKRGLRALKVEVTK